VIPAKIVNERLGHASVAITMGTYSHVLPGLAEQAAGTGRSAHPWQPRRQKASDDKSLTRGRRAARKGREVEGELPVSGGVTEGTRTPDLGTTIRIARACYGWSHGPETDQDSGQLGRRPHLALHLTTDGPRRILQFSRPCLETVMVTIGADLAFSPTSSTLWQLGCAATRSCFASWPQPRPTVNRLPAGPNRPTATV
jgi:hypothetical protein